MLLSGGRIPPESIAVFGIGMLFLVLALRRFRRITAAAIA